MFTFSSYISNAHKVFRCFLNLLMFIIARLIVQLILLLLTLKIYYFRTTHEFLFGALAELVDNARYVVFQPIIACSGNFMDHHDLCPLMTWKMFLLHLLQLLRDLLGRNIFIITIIDTFLDFLKFIHCSLCSSLKIGNLPLPNHLPLCIKAW